jgi:hypothetical protein
VKSTVDRLLDEAVEGQGWLPILRQIPGLAVRDL